MVMIRGFDITDHHACEPSAHTFDAGNADYEGRLDARGRTECNGCGVVMFYCTNDDMYHHAGQDVPSCFLVQEVSYPVPVPGFAEIPAGMSAVTSDSVRHVVARFDGDHYVMVCDDGARWTPDRLVCRPMSSAGLCGVCFA